MPEAMLPETDELRKALFTICETKEHLHDWVQCYLGIDLPDCIVCDDDTRHPPSNSSPMDLLWELYQKAIDGHDEAFTEVLVYAARDSYKTVISSIMEVLCLFHLKRDPFHVAAIESQAARCTDYIQKYLKRPILRDYIVSKNKRIIEICWYENDVGDTLTPKQYAVLLDQEKAHWFEELFKVEVLVATVNSLNSGHSSFLCCDELDLVPPGPLEEAKMIPSEGRVKRELPITLMISSRKFARGPIQDVLDNLDEHPVQVRHWNIIDVTEACPPERHLPDEPKIPIYFSENRLDAISEEKYNALDVKSKQDYFKQEGYAGCLKNCKLFSVCQGRLATKQKSKSRLLKSIRKVQSTFRSLRNIDVAKSQLMGWKPSGEGMVYARFDPAIHMLSPAQIANRMTGEEYPESYSKGDLIALAKAHGAEFFSGVDWGYSHCFAAVIGFKYGFNFYMVECHEVPELDPNEQIDLYRPLWELYQPSCYADMAQPGSIKSFRKAGFRVIDWQKKPNSVLDGIRVVQSMLLAPLGMPPTLYLVRGDDGCEHLAKRIGKYHWKLDTEGRPTAVPDDVEDDACDALRYVLMNLFAPKGAIIVSSDKKDANGTTIGYVDPSTIKEPTQSNYLQYYINQALGDRSTEVPEAKRGKKGRLFWSLD